MIGILEKMINEKNDKYLMRYDKQYFYARYINIWISHQLCLLLILYDINNAISGFLVKRIKVASFVNVNSLSVFFSMPLFYFFYFAKPFAHIIMFTIVCVIWRSHYSVNKFIKFPWNSHLKIVRAMARNRFTM